MNLDLTQLVAIAAALGWASGLRLYAVVFITGLAGRLGWIQQRRRERRLGLGSGSAIVGSDFGPIPTSGNGPKIGTSKSLSQKNG